MLRLLHQQRRDSKSFDLIDEVFIDPENACMMDYMHANFPSIILIPQLVERIPMTENPIVRSWGHKSFSSGAGGLDTNGYCDDSSRLTLDMNFDNNGMQMRRAAYSFECPPDLDYEYYDEGHGCGPADGAFAALSDAFARYRLELICYDPKRQLVSTISDIDCSGIYENEGNFHDFMMSNTPEDMWCPCAMTTAAGADDVLVRMNVGCYDKRAAPADSEGLFEFYFYEQVLFEIFLNLGEVSVPNLLRSAKWEAI